MKNKKPIAPDRVGLSLHKHLVPEVLEKAPALEMNPNEFVNACVEACVNAMLQKNDPGPGRPEIGMNIAAERAKPRLPYRSVSTTPSMRCYARSMKFSTT